MKTSEMSTNPMKEAFVQLVQEFETVNLRQARAMINSAEQFNIAMERAQEGKHYFRMQLKGYRYLSESSEALDELVAMARKTKDLCAECQQHDFKGTEDFAQAMQDCLDTSRMIIETVTEVAETFSQFCLCAEEIRRKLAAFGEVEVFLA